MLRNSLMGLNPEGGRDWLEGLGERADIELTRRPEELSIEEFIRLSDACTNLGEEAS
jgi:16S rRNA A1518/A1519 N6-dimethyltransferase RsmA/KsgA/DIM1 with predicted DNA glycosylase/AP lyase activity